MNGVRRLFTAAITPVNDQQEQYSSPVLIAPAVGTSWNPTRSSSESSGTESSSTAHSLSESAAVTSPPTTPLSIPRRNMLHFNTTPQLLTKPDSQSLTTSLSSRPPVRQDLLLSLLATEAVIDSKGFRTLTPDELQALKKEQSLLAERIDSLNKKLKLETKIRDAAISLNKSRSRSKEGTPAVSTKDVESATRKVESVQSELFKLKERSNRVNQQVLEHNSSILSAALSRLGGKDIPSGSDAQSLEDLSPTSSSTSFSTTPAASNSRLDSSQFYAGHSSAKQPPGRRAIERQLSQLSEALEMSRKREDTVGRDLKHLLLEKETQEAKLTGELQSAEDRIAQLRHIADRVSGLESQLRQLTEQKDLLARSAERNQTLSEAGESQAKALQDQLKALQRQVDSANELVAQLENKTASQGEHHRTERMHLETQLKDHARKWEEEKHDWDLERTKEVTALQSELSEQRTDMDEVKNLLRTYTSFACLSTSETQPESVIGLLTVLGDHLHQVSEKLEQLERNHNHIREKDTGEMELGPVPVQVNSQKISRTSLKGVGGQLRDPEAPTAIDTSSMKRNLPVYDDSVMFQLKSLWMQLPSPESRALKTGGRSPTRGTSSPMSSPSSTGPSLSDLDVRALRALYDPKTASMPQTPVGDFTVEALTKRVQAVIADDRALIERLIRFAQSHELLKSNAERAQRLARESSQALETYQRQVKTLQERKEHVEGQQMMLNEQVQDLKEALNQSMHENLKLKNKVYQYEADAEVKNREVEQTPSTISNESNQDEVNRLTLALRKAEDELDAIHSAEQTQQMALMEELNNMQTENGQLREQLRMERGKSGR